MANTLFLIATTALLTAVQAITVHQPLSLQPAQSPHLLSPSHSLPRNLRFVHLQQIPQQTQQRVIATLRYPAVLPVAAIDTQQFPELKNLAILQHNPINKARVKPFGSKIEPITNQFAGTAHKIPIRHRNQVKPKTKPFASDVQPITIGEHLAELNKQPAVLPSLKLANQKAGFRAVSSIQPIGLVLDGKRKALGNGALGLADNSAGRPFPLTAIDNEYASIDHLSSQSARLQHSAPHQSAHSTSHAHKGEKGGGAESEGEHHSSRAGKHGKGGSSSHHKQSASKGQAGKEIGKKYHEADGGGEHAQHESAHEQGSHDHADGGASKGGYKAGGERAKGGFVKGFRSKYGKNEFHKSDKFWKDGQEKGDFEEFGKKGSSHYKFGAKKKKGGKKQSSAGGGESGKSGESAGGHDHSDSSGHKGEHGHQESSAHGAEYATKGGKASHKEYKTR